MNAYNLVSKNATIYELNTRQFTAEGTFRAAEEQLPRLKELGVDILWLMPIHQIGEKNRKGTPGQPLLGEGLLQREPRVRHAGRTSSTSSPPPTQLGLHVILDWVANHTAWDNPLVTQHPEWYQRDWKGDFRPTPWWDWGDIIDLDYRQPGLRQYMTDGDEVLGDRGGHRRLPLRRGRLRARRLLEQRPHGNSMPSSRCSCWRNGSRATSTPRPST